MSDKIFFCNDKKGNLLYIEDTETYTKNLNTLKEYFKLRDIKE